MREEEIKKIEKELLSQIDQEVDLDKQIDSQANEIASSLATRGAANARIDNKNLYIVVQHKKDKIVMAAADREKFKLMKDRYRPYTIEAEMDNKFTFQENLKATVEAFIRHLLGEVRVGPLEEGEVIEDE